ncbi:Tn3 family transposase [Streptomyces sp. NPDC059999]|uniref:Tn3 family transposase n=1 Tax=Streptomyces sp. NPDC059999 TaxID=3347030 RepID=UPI0036CAFCB6
MSAKDGKLALDRLGPAAEPKLMPAFRQLVNGMLPKVDFPELLLEVAELTGMTSAFTHISGADPSMEEFELSVCALLLSEACNVGLTPVVKPNVPALTRGRLVQVDQGYLRAETISAANGMLIDAQRGIDVVRAWGGGLVASADGVRFTVPVQSLHAGYSPKYFGLRHKGATWLNVVNDQVMGLGGVVIPGTLRDSLFILDALLGRDGGPKPETVITDTASYLVTWTPCSSLRAGGGRTGRRTRRWRRRPCECERAGRTGHPVSSCSTRAASRSRWSPGSCGSSQRGTARRTRSSRTPTTCGTCGCSSLVVV